MQRSVQMTADDMHTVAGQANGNSGSTYPVGGFAAGFGVPYGGEVAWIGTVGRSERWRRRAARREDCLR
jgi:hypothetical protein